MRYNKFIFFVFFINLIILFINADKKAYSERLYVFRLSAFNRTYDIYCSKTPIGYYKYPIRFNGIDIYITYETNIFYNQCKFDENLKIDPELYPSNLWANNKGEVMRFKKRYAPVIEKNRQRKHYPNGFGKN